MDWIEKNIEVKLQKQVIRKGMTAVELLPILEQSAAWGVNKFKKLIKF